MYIDYVSVKLFTKDRYRALVRPVSTIVTSQFVNGKCMHSGGMKYLARILHSNDRLPVRIIYNIFQFTFCEVRLYTIENYIHNIMHIVRHESAR